MFGGQYRHISSLSYLLSHATVKKNPSNLPDGRQAPASLSQNRWARHLDIAGPVAYPTVHGWTESA
jgi:hypothetical protein